MSVTCIVQVSSAVEVRSFFIFSNLFTFLPCATNVSLWQVMLHQIIVLGSCEYIEKPSSSIKLGEMLTCFSESKPL
jgi:hypothetical protein